MERTRPPRQLSARISACADFRRAIISDWFKGFSCLVGTVVHESHFIGDAIRTACGASILRHAETLEAGHSRRNRHKWWTQPRNTKSLALHTQTVLQSGFILAKEKGGPEMAQEAVSHLKTYIRLLFITPEE